MIRGNSKSHPLISVIVPVYNTACYLPRCLDSLCAQSYEHLQIICVDDGSTDNSPAILKEYATRDPRIVLITQLNAGLAAARNAGLRAARGEWITGLDSDDWIEVDTYETLLPATSDASVDIICFDFMTDSEDTSVADCPYLHCAYSGPQVVTPGLLLNTNCFFVTKLWRKDFLDAHQVHFPEGLHYEDACFYYMLAPFARRIHFSPRALYHYWQRSESIMHKRSAKGADHLEVIRLVLLKYRTKPLSSSFGSTRPTRFELYLLENYTTYALDHTPDELHPAIRQRAAEIAAESGILQTFPRESAWLAACGRGSGLFRKARRGKLSYSLLNVPLVSFQFKSDSTIIRLFGIKISQQHITL